MYSSYAVFTHMVDPARGLEVPVGVALWSTDRKSVKLRMLSEDERLSAFRTATDFPFVAHVHEKVNLWIEEEHLPYLDVPAKPWDTKWWAHAKRLLVHRTRLSDPMPVEPSFDIDSLYESVVAPFVHKAESKRRVDGEVSRCLSELAPMMRARATVPGIGGRSVVVTRAYEGQHATVVVEGVNLAAHPDVNADQALGKLLRLRSGMQGKCDIATTPSGDALLGLLAWVAEQERARIRARTVGRRRELADLGLYVAGRLPLGYRRDDGRRLAVDAEEAALVREIFTRCSAGESLSDIASTLPPAREKARWTVYRVHRVLRSRYVLGETRRGDGSWALGNHPALVSHDLWDRAHVALRARVAGGRKYTQGESAQRLLRGLVKCSACGRRVSVRFGARHQLPDATGARVHYYVCRGVLAGRACGEGWIRSYEADAAAAEKVMARLAEIREHLAAPPSVVPRRERSTSVAGGLAKIEERKRKAVDLATDGAMSSAVLQETLARYEAEAAALRLRAEREEAERRREERAADPESRAQLLRHVGALRAAWAAMAVPQHQEVLALLAEEIQIGRSGVQIRWRSVAALAEAPGGDHLVTQP